MWVPKSRDIRICVNAVGWRKMFNNKQRFLYTRRKQASLKKLPQLSALALADDVVDDDRLHAVHGDIGFCFQA